MRLVRIVFGVMVILLWMGGLVRQGFAQDTLIEFNLEDQFGQVHSRVDLPDGPLVLIVSDKDGSQYNEMWVQHIDSVAASPPSGIPVRFVGIATLKGVPRLLRKFVRRKIRGMQTEPVLLDWSGQFADAYQLKGTAANILMFDADRRLALRLAVTDMNPSDSREISEAVRLLRAE